MIYKTVAFTGHRPKSLADCSDWWKTALSKAVVRATQKGFNRFVTGGALGVDLEAASIVHAAREWYSIESWVIIPCANQEALWSADDQTRYREVLAEADRIEYTSRLDYKGPWQMWKRNRYMLTLADVLVAVLREDAKEGGAFGTVNEAIQRSLRVYQIDPFFERERWL